MAEQTEHPGMLNWAENMAIKWRFEKENGLHDDACEYRRHFYLCHCSKRRREARGLTEPPTFWYRSPQCSHCFGDLWHDGDGWRCEPCRTSWSSDANDGDKGEFNDEYGTLNPPDTGRLDA